VDLLREGDRIAITVTDSVAEALDAAALRWPEVASRKELLLRRLRRTRGALTGVYELEYLERRCDDRPA
jgi:hypothetical protein